MTNEEAIKLLEDVKSRVECFDVYIDKEEGKALDLAIKALENEPVCIAKVTFDENKLKELRAENDGLKNQLDDLCENLAWYINERNRLISEKKRRENDDMEQ